MASYTIASEGREEGSRQAILSNSPCRWSRSLRHSRSSVAWPSEQRTFHCRTSEPTESTTHFIHRHFCPWKTKSFWRRHKPHKVADVTKLIASYFLLCFQKDASDSKEQGTEIWKISVTISHIRLATTHSKNRCWIDTGFEQNTHEVSGTAYRLARLSLIKLLSCTINHKKTWILSGTLIFHI